MGCKQSRTQEGAGYAAGSGSDPARLNGNKLGLLEAPEDGYVPHICSFGETNFAVAGGDGWLYLYDWQRVQLASKFRAHKKAVSRVLEGPNGLLFTGSADASVRLWKEADIMAGSQSPAQTFEGHLMWVSDFELLDDWGQGQSHTGSAQSLITGSRDCTLRLWDLEGGSTIQQHKILRNVVTAMRRVPAGPGSGVGAVVQASEDLQLRLWDTRAGLLKGPSMAVRSGPNQLICLDVAKDGSWVACGSKGFSRENCEVKVFDIRSGLRELTALPCADQNLESLRCVGSDRCLTASKDGQIRALEVPDLRVVAERRGGSDGSSAYTAFGVSSPMTGLAGPTALAASVSPEGVGLEMLTWPDQGLESPPTLIATT